MYHQVYALCTTKGRETVLPKFGLAPATWALLILKFDGVCLFLQKNDEWAYTASV